MKVLNIVILFFISLLPVNALPTEASKFVEQQYKKCGSGNVHIVVKKEHTQEYRQTIGNKLVLAITYGYGDMKTNKTKCKITYIVLLNCTGKPIWCCITPSK